MLDQVIQHACPFFGLQQAVKPFGAQAPGRGIGERKRFGRGRFDQAVTLHQARKPNQPMRAAADATADEPRIAADFVEGFAFFCGFGFVESADMQGQNALCVREQKRGADGSHANVKAERVGNVFFLHAAIRFG